MSSDSLITSERILNYVYDRLNNALKVQISSGSIALELRPGDIEIGAVELKDAETDTRAFIDALHRLAVIADQKHSTGGEPYRMIVSDTPVKLLSTNPNRKKYVVQNLSDEFDFYIGGNSVAYDTGFRVTPYGIFGDEMPYCGVEEIYGVTKPGETVTVVVKEWE